MGIKRIAAMLASAMLLCTLCIAAAPRAALAAADYTMDFAQNSTVDWSGKPVDYSQDDDSGAGWSWNAAKSTLTLSGLQFETVDPTALKLPAGATLVLRAGTVNAVTSAYDGGGHSRDSYGLFGVGALTVTGGGSLRATGGVSTKASYGVRADGLTVSGGSKLIGAAGTGDTASVGVVYAFATVTDTSVLEGYGGTSVASSAGVFDANTDGSLTISGSARVTGIGGDAPVSYGVGANLGITMTGGTLIADSTAGLTIKAALFPVDMQPNLGGYASYRWRTAKTDAYTDNSVAPYVITDPPHLYVEIRPGAGGGGGTGTDGGSTGTSVPRTGDHAQPLLYAVLLTLALAGLAVSMREKRRARKRR